MYSKTLNVIVFYSNGRKHIFDARQFDRDSEHITLDTAKDGSEVGYVNHTECFGGTFTGI